MGTFIEGLDYALVDVDYDKYNRDVLEESFIPTIRDKHLYLWDFVDFCFDDSVRCSGIDIGIEAILRCVEEFCKVEKITEIPAIYSEMFDAGQGFMTQAKMPRAVATVWLERFPNPIPGGYERCKALDTLEDFLMARKSETKAFCQYQYTLSWLRQFTLVTVKRETF